MSRHFLGSWTAPSGNSCDVYVARSARHPGYDLFFEWDQPPPLSWHDELDYVGRIRPAVLARARAHFQDVGLTLVVEP